MNLEEVLNAYKNDDLSLEDALALSRSGFLNQALEDIGHTVVDHDRAARTGAGEVVFGEGKTAQQIRDIVATLVSHGTNALVTRIDPAKFAQAKALGLPESAQYADDAQVLTCMVNAPETAAGTVGVITAGTSDQPVAEEAALTAEFFGNPVMRISDVGVAGLHRLLARLPEIRSARVLIVCAGMEGALPSVIGGLVDKPVIAVPTSVGYGAAFNGMAALLGMLTSCASGVAVVNINNGFGAAHLANSINRL